jgi:hypothetical protein
VFLAAVAQHRLRFRTLVYALPLYHPLLIRNLHARQMSGRLEFRPWLLVSEIISAQPRRRPGDLRGGAELIIKGRPRR